MYWCGCVVMAYVNVPNATVERTKSKEGKGGKKKTNHKHFVLRIWISFLSGKNVVEPGSSGGLFHFIMH